MSHDNDDIRIAVVNQTTTYKIHIFDYVIVSELCETVDFTWKFRGSVFIQDQSDGLAMMGSS